MEFWNSEIADASWEELLKLKKEIKFVLIGGWAVYIYTKLEKSKDIDIIVDYDSLKKLEQIYTISKNPILLKYEIKTSKFDIDIYLPYYSKLIVPPQDIVNMTRSVEGFTLPIPEVLLLLKIGAFNSRKTSIKGRKDLIDILGLLLFSEVDKPKFNELAKKYSVDLTFLRAEIKRIDDETLRYLKLNKHEFSKLKDKLILY